MDPSPVFDVFVDGEYRCTIGLDPAGGIGNSPFEPPVVVGGRVVHLFRDERTDVPFFLAYELDEACTA